MMIPVESRRQSLLGYGPHGLALEVNPWQTQEAVEAVLLYRGAILAGWANVETSLIEIAIRASYHEAYLGHRQSYPSKLKSRIQYLSEILYLAGPLQPYAKLGHAILRRFSGSADLRNTLAHGRMTVLPNWGAVFYVFKPKNDSEITYRQERLTLDQLERFAYQVSRFSRAVRKLVDEVDHRGLLPSLQVAEGGEG